MSQKNTSNAKTGFAQSTIAKTKAKPKKPSLSSKEKARKDFELTLTLGGRNFVQHPYSNDEKRVAHWLSNIAGVGGGEDPIGFMIASHEMLARERQDLKRQIAALQLDIERLTKIRSYDEISSDELAEESFQIGNEYARRAKAEKAEMETLKKFVSRGQNAQKAVNEIIKKAKKSNV